MANWMKLMKNQDANYQHNLKYLQEFQETKSEPTLEWLILNNANLVHKIVGNYRNFYGHKLAYDDLFSVGLDGLVRAIQKFDCNFNTNFSTYATYWIKQGIVRHISDEGFMVKIPTHLFETLQQIVKIELQNDGVIDKDKICEDLAITDEKFELISQVRNGMLSWSSINRPVSAADDTEIGDLMSTESGTRNLSTDSIPRLEKTFETEELQSAISEGLKTLDGREQLIIIHRFGLFGAEVRTLADIGKTEGISRERIRQIETRAIRKLRKALHNYHLYVNL